MRLIFSAVAVSLLAALLVFPSSAALAAPAVPVSVPAVVPSAGEGYDFTPSGSGVKKYILNILGSVLGASMPKKWQAEQIANQFQYDHSWDGIEVRTGIKAGATPGYLSTTDYATNPQTNADYTLQNYEMQLKGGKGGTPFAPPATKTAKFIKGAGAAAVAVTGYSMGVAIGQGGMQLFGFNADEAVCFGGGLGHADEGRRAIVNMISNTDCSFYDLDATYAINLDGGGWGVTRTCAFSGSFCVNGIKSISSTEGGSGQPGFAICLNTEGSLGASDNTRVYVVYAVNNPPASKYWFGGVPGRVVASAGVSVMNDYVPGTSGVRPLACGGEVSSPPLGYQILRANTPAPAGATIQIASAIAETTEIICLYRKTANWDITVSQNPDGSCKVVVAGSSTAMSTVPVSSLDDDPLRTLKCSVLGTDGVNYFAESAPFRESSKEVQPPCDVDLPDGVTAQNLKVDSVMGGVSTPLWDQSVTAEYMSWWNAYPECRAGACKLDLVSKGGSFPVSCFDLEYDCADWFDDPARVDNYECHYGMHTVDIDECFVYSGLFKPGRIAAGAPYSDPMTGEWSGGENSPSPDRQALSQAVQNPETSRSCNGMKAVGFDPVAWVMRPIQCALEWAFVPRATVVAVSFASAKLAWQDTPLMHLLDGIAELQDLDAPGGGCMGPHLDFTGTHLGDLGYPFSACDGPKADAAGYVSLLITVLVGLGCLGSIGGSIAGVVGMSKPPVGD